MIDSLMIEPKAPAYPTLRARRLSVHALLLAGLAAILATTLNLSAQSGGAPASASTASSQALSSNRFLFVVDTSAGMKRHLPDVVNVVQDIIRSSANGQLHNGDTIGVWTFNDTIYTGNLPLQQWLAEDSEEIALRMTEFFRQQPFAKRSRLDLAMLGVAEIVKHSDIITIFIISDGSSRMQGTPFDQQINTSYQQSLQDMKKDRRPIVTVLQAKGGRFIRYTVNAVPWPVVIPEVPIPLKLANANVAAARPAPAATGVVLTNTTVTTESKPTPATATVPPQTPPTTPPIASAPQPAPQPQSTVLTEPATPPALPPQIPPVAAPTAMAPTPAVPASNSAATMPTPAMPARPTPEPATVVAKPPTVSPAALPRGATPATTKPAMPTNQVMALNKTPSTPSPKPAQVPVSNPKPTMNRTNVAPAPPKPKASLLAQGTAVIKSFAGDHPKILLIGSGVMIVVALGLIVVLVRRSRRSARISLISQSLTDQ